MAVATGHPVTGCDPSSACAVESEILQWKIRLVQQLPLRPVGINASRGGDCRATIKMRDARIASRKIMAANHGVGQIHVFDLGLQLAPVVLADLATEDHRDLVGLSDCSIGIE
jgi:hypothetical protein